MITTRSLYNINNFLCMWHLLAGMALFAAGVAIFFNNEIIVKCQRKNCVIQNDTNVLFVVGMYMMYGSFQWYSGTFVGIWAGATSFAFGFLVLSGVSRKIVNMGFFTNWVAMLVMIPAVLLSAQQVVSLMKFKANKDTSRKIVIIRITVEFILSFIQLFLFITQLIINGNRVKLRQTISHIDTILPKEGRA